MGSSSSAPRHSYSAFNFIPKRYPRESTLLLLLVLLVALFIVTGVFTRAFHQKESAIAQDWLSRGQAALTAGKSREARDDFRNALVFEPQNPVYQLHLAEALASYGQPEQARGYLLNLLSQSPADGEVNLQLARLAAHDDRIGEAVHYYRGAVYGFTDSPAQGLSTRLEFCQFLVDVGDNSQAEGELALISFNVPANAAGTHIKIGDLYVRAGNLNRALSEFQTALRALPENTTALEKAGSAAYQLADFRLAESYLSRLPERSASAPSDAADLKAMLQTSRMINSIDPLVPNLSNADRAHRTAVVLGQIIDRLSACLSRPPSNGSDDLRPYLDRARAMRQSEWSERNLLGNPDRIHVAIQFVFDLEQKAGQTCGPPQGMDLAISVMARTHQSAKGPLAQ